MVVLGAIKSQEMKAAGPVFNPRPVEPRSNKASPSEEKPSGAGARADPIDPIKNEQQKIVHIAEAMDNYLDSVQCDIEITVYEKTGDILVKVISKSDGKVIREIPPEEMLNLAAKMEEMVGALFNETV
jgi:flagellar protein FlaG